MAIIMNTEIYRVGQLKNTLKSFKLLIKRLRLREYDYYFDLLKSEISIYPTGIILRVGDSYQYILPAKFEAIG